MLIIILNQVYKENIYIIYNKYNIFCYIFIVYINSTARKLPIQKCMGKKSLFN